VKVGSAIESIDWLTRAGSPSISMRWAMPAHWATMRPCGVTASHRRRPDGLRSKSQRQVARSRGSNAGSIAANTRLKVSRTRASSPSS